MEDFDSLNEQIVWSIFNMCQEQRIGAVMFNSGTIEVQGKVMFYPTQLT